LLILDNCDDVGTDYSRYIPNGSKVSVILTTRLSDAKKYASADSRDTRSKLFLQLQGLDERSAVDLVLDASDIQERSQQTEYQARQIGIALQFHPLAIIVASSLIQSAVYSLEKYVNALGRRLAQKELLDTKSEQARYQKVSTTFEVSAESLQSLASTDPSAKGALALLDILAYMHHQGVSEEMFVRAWKYEEAILSEFKDGDAEDDGDVEHLSPWHVDQCRTVFPYRPLGERTMLFRKARAHLDRLSLVTTDRAENSISLHSIVHAWARERNSHPGEAWTAAASTLALSTEGRKDWRPFTSQLLRHHETSFAIWQDMGGPISSKLGLCRIWNVYAWQMCRASSDRTVEICLHLLRQTQELLRERPEQLPVLRAQYLLGIAYQDNGQISEAVEMLEHVVKVQEKLAEDHPDRLASQHVLAGVYRANGQISEAVEMLEHVVKVQEKLAEDHPSRLASQHELAGVYRANGQISEAVEMLEHVVKVEEKLAEDHLLRSDLQA